MKKKLFLWQATGFVFTGIMGVILHFLFNWTNQSIIVAPFSAVNESIWEHMKLLFFPMFIFSLLENVYVGKSYKKFWCVKLIGIIIGLISLPVLYYTLNGIFGSIPDFVNIAIFYVATAFVYVFEFWLFGICIMNCKNTKTAIGILILIAVIFVVLTFAPLRIQLFSDPITNTYGYYKIV